MAATLPRLACDAVRARQDAIYRDPTQWWESTPVSAASRLRCVLRYLMILDWCGVRPRTQGLHGGLRILEPGCGVGSLSSLLAMFGEVASFDVSPEAVRQAQAMFRHLPSLTFFEADGTHPDRIAQLGDGTFDLVLLREFLPLARDIAGSPRPLDIVGGYYRRLRAGGVLIIEHALPPGAWGRNEGILQTAKLVRAFRGQVFHTLALDVAQGFSPGFRGRSGRMLQVCATMLSPLVVAYCLLRRINLSKTVIIRKPDVP